MPGNNANIVRRLFEEFWNNKNFNVVDEILTPDSRNHDPNTPDLGTGPEGYKKLGKMYTTAFPDVRLTIDDLLESGDNVVVRWRANGTHKGDLRGIAPTGKKMDISGITIARISNGKIADHWVQWSALTMMQQLGAVPTEQPRQAA
jgi:steroid delta-isomerase-like uncharacterized protein